MSESQEDVLSKDGLFKLHTDPWGIERRTGHLSEYEIEGRKMVALERIADSLERSEDRA